MAESTGTFKILTRIWKEHTRKYIPHIVVGMLLTTIIAAAEAYSVSLLKPIFDKGFEGQDTTLLKFLCFQIFAVYAGKGALYYFQQNLMTWVATKTIMSIRYKVFQHLMTLDLKFFNENASSQLLARIINETTSIQNIAINFIQNVFKDVVTVVSMFALMLINSWQMFVGIILIVPIGAVAIQKISKKIKGVATTSASQNAFFMTFISESLQNIKIVKSYCMEKVETKRLDAMFGDMFKMVMGMSRLSSAVNPIMESLTGIILAGIVLFGGWQVSSGAMTTGGFVTFLGAWVAAYKPLKNLLNFRVNLQMALVSANRIYELLDAKPSFTDAKDAVDMPKIKKGIELKNVSFEYEAGKPILKGVNISVPAGKTVALVGHSGGGKSTVVNLVPRFFDVNGGSISVDGIDIRNIKQKSLRESISLVSQEVMLFDDTVRANIAYGKGDKEGKVSDKDIESAAAAANAAGFIEKMSEKYETQIGEKGVKLSGGQKQRISIARALIKDAPVLLLDEATSALDTESEHEVQNALDNLMKNRTTIVIAHRLSTIVNADKIYVIDKGEVVESGTHKALLAKDGAYAKLYNMQFKDKKKKD